MGLVAGSRGFRGLPHGGNPLPALDRKRCEERSVHGFFSNRRPVLLPPLEQQPKLSVDSGGCFFSGHEFWGETCGVVWGYSDWAVVSESDLEPAAKDPRGSFATGYFLCLRPVLACPDISAHRQSCLSAGAP